MRRGFLATTVTLALLASSVADAATLSATTAKEGKVTVTLTGEITEGDADGFKNIIRRANDRNQVVGTIRLNSSGGSLVEGVKLADIVRFGRIATAVIGTAKCASACFIVFAAGGEKYANYAALVGVHGASDGDGQETTESGAATVTMARIAKTLGVPPNIIGKMVVTPPDEIVWLTVDDLRSMGTVMLGKPSQIPPDSPKPLQAPTQLHPSENATANETPTPTWDSLLDRAMELSKKQNGGTPNIQRICQPELKECINGLSFDAPDGTHMVMKATEDTRGKMLKREVCSFNSFGDVRVCVNWDTGEKHRDMKNKNGDWYGVDDN